MQLLVDMGCDIHLSDENENSLLHHAAVGQGNATLYCRYLVEKGLLPSIKNKQGYTPRAYAQNMDRFKFHRVVKLLREMEDKERKQTTVEEADTWLDKLLEDTGKSMALAVAFGVFVFLLRFAVSNQLID